MRDIDPRAQSRAEAPPRSRLSIVIGIVTVTALGVGFAIKLTRERPANVPQGLLGLRFGATLTETKALLPSLEPSPGASEKHFARTRLFDEPALCEFGFKTRDRLMRIDCKLDPPPAPARELVTCDKLLSTFKSMYGRESRYHQPDGGRRWEWHNERASLLLTCRQAAASADGKGEFSVENWSRDDS